MVKIIDNESNEKDIQINTEITVNNNSEDREKSEIENIDSHPKENLINAEESDTKSSQKKELIRTLKYLFFTSSAGLIQVISFTLLNEVIFKGKYYWPCYLVALVLSVIWNFTLNRRYTFKSANNVPVAMFKVFLYYLVFTPLSTWWGEALTTKADWNEYLVLCFTMIINLVTEFTFCRFVVFRASIDTNTLADKEKKRSV